KRSTALIDQVTPALGHFQREGRAGPGLLVRRSFVRTSGQSGERGERDGTNPEHRLERPEHFISWDGSVSGWFGCRRSVEDCPLNASILPLWRRAGQRSAAAAFVAYISEALTPWSLATMTRRNDDYVPPNRRYSADDDSVAEDDPRLTRCPD